MKNKLFLCIGGPLDGQWKVRQAAAGYIQYTCKTESGFLPATILVWKETLDGSKLDELPVVPRRSKAKAPRHTDLQMWEVERVI
ncbi:MAG: hypothetical protein WA766_11835, partial [Candidatus Acidiferrales bacterium]